MADYLLTAASERGYDDMAQAISGKYQLQTTNIGQLQDILGNIRQSIGNDLGVINNLREVTAEDRRYLVEKFTSDEAKIFDEIGASPMQLGSRLKAATRMAASVFDNPQAYYIMTGEITPALAAQTATMSEGELEPLRRTVEERQQRLLVEKDTNNRLLDDWKKGVDQIINNIIGTPVKPSQHVLEQIVDAMMNKNFDKAQELSSPFRYMPSFEYSSVIDEVSYNNAPLRSRILPLTDDQMPGVPAKKSLTPAP